MAQELLAAIPSNHLPQIHLHSSRIQFALLKMRCFALLRILCRVLLAFVEVVKGFLVGELLLMLLIAVLDFTWSICFFQPVS